MVILFGTYLQQPN